MKLAAALAREHAKPLERVMLLRHFNTRVDAIERNGASLEEFTLTQPKDTPYDFRLEGKEPIEIVGTTAGDVLVAVYQITGIEQEGSNRVITSDTFRALDGVMKYPERTVRHFDARRLDSVYVGRKIGGWTNPRLGTARMGNKIFETATVGRAR